ncbi:hypothetical protein RND71_023377 [Anisodus tanguticus]|uniref:Uncharacterized protein n=1 Tax=Anisodus tanguticus TaxID=243964 RepID=A0AAE1RVF1_9SOLA|nr:hypothetical protein RND71_023377 [Anisodus tanguticus]
MLKCIYDASDDNEGGHKGRWSILQTIISLDDLKDAWKEDFKATNMLNDDNEGSHKGLWSILPTIISLDDIKEAWKEDFKATIHLNKVKKGRKAQLISKTTLEECDLLPKGPSSKKENLITKLIAELSKANEENEKIVVETAILRAENEQLKEKK